MQLADFHPLGPAEQRLVDWLTAGNRGTCAISGGVPPADTPEVRLRASLIRHLALGGCDACRPPETGVRVRGAWVFGDEARGEETRGLDFAGATLPGDLALIACRIPDRVVLHSALLKNLFLNDSYLDAGIAGDRLQAEGGLLLRRGRLDGTLRLPGARIAGELDCESARLRNDGVALMADWLRADGGVVLRGAEVDGTIRLPSARIGGHLSCVGAKLRSESKTFIADGLHAEGCVFMRGAEVDCTIRLIGARIGGDLDLDGASLRTKGDALLAEGAQIISSLFLREGAKVAGRLLLTGAEIGAISDDPTCWPPRIELDRCRYGAFLGDAAPIDAASRLDWLSRIPTKAGEFRPDAYEHCAKVLRELGHGGAARDILIAKERLQRRAARERVAQRDLNFGAPLAALMRVRDGVLGLTVGYGRQPLRAFLFLAGFWALGTWIFAQAAATGQIKPNLPQMQAHPAWVDCRDGGARRGAEATQVDCFLAQPEGASYPTFNAPLYAADTLFPVVALEVQSYWTPDDRKPFGGWARRYLWLHIVMGWALTLLAVAGFSGLIKTDSR